RLQIEFGQKCNVRCIMCTQNHTSKVELDGETLVNNIEIPRSCGPIILQGGETLILDSAKQFFDHTAASGGKVSILTNGTAISEVMAEKIALHCQYISFS